MFIASPEQSGARQLSPANSLLVELDNPIPATLAVGAGTALSLSGWCWHPAQALHQIVAIINQGAAGQHEIRLMTQVVTQHDMPPTATQKPAAAAHPVYRFWALLTIPSAQTKTLAIKLRATLADGSFAETVVATPHLAEQSSFALALRAGLPAPASPRFTGEANAQDKVAICMATYNPDPAMFRRQIESIRAQTHPRWVCVISDDGSDETKVREMLAILGADERFFFYPFSERLNFYHNFERALTLAPVEAEFIALADQDDYWFPQKLATLLAQLDEGTELAYSDLRLVTPAGEVQCNTYWTLRQNNFTRLGPLLLMNTVPGASALFRRSLLEGLLPFPPRTGHIFHDQWLSITALARGPLNYVDAPLYDYVQHNANVVGYAEQRRPSWRILLRSCYAQLATPTGRQGARQIFFAHLPRITLLARVAAMRAGQRATWPKRWVLERAAQLDHSWRSMLWLLWQGLRDWRQVGLTNGTEFYLLSALCWRQRIWLQRWWKQ